MTDGSRRTPRDCVFALLISCSFTEQIRPMRHDQFAMATQIGRVWLLHLRSDAMPSSTCIYVQLRNRWLGKPARKPCASILPLRVTAASEVPPTGSIHRAPHASGPVPSRTCSRIAAPYRAARRPADSITVSVRTKSTRGQPGRRKIAPFEAQRPPQDPSPDRDLERPVDAPDP